MDQNQSFVTTFKDSVSNFSGYKNFLSRTFGSTFKYIYLLLLIVAFVGSVKAAILLVPQIPSIDKFVTGAKEFIQVGYPSGLVVDIKNGQLSTNQADPYFIDLPKQFENKSQPTKFHLVAIDTKGRVEDFVKYNSVVLLTKTAAVSTDKNDALKVYLFKSNYNFKVDKNSYDAIAVKVIPYLAYTKPLIIGFAVISLIIGPFFLAGFGLIGKMISLLLWSILFFIIAKVMSKNLSYKEIYKISFFGSSLPVVLSTLLNFVSFPASYFYQIPNIIFLIIMVYVLVKFEVVKVNVNSPRV